MTKPLLIVVDDEHDVAKFIGHVGETVGFEVEIATSGRKFQKIWEERNPDAIVLDIVMPDMDGNELINWLHCCPKRFSVIAFLQGLQGPCAPDGGILS